MANLEGELRRRVETAREQDASKREAARQAELAANEAMERRKARCRELGPTIEESFRAAANASDGAIVYRGPAFGGIGTTVYHLEWRAPAPARALRVTNHYLNGRLEWDWIVNGFEQRGASADPLEFDRASLEPLILQLAEQSRWLTADPPRGSIRTLRL